MQRQKCCPRGARWPQRDVPRPPSTPGDDAVLPWTQDKDGQKQCVAHNTFRGRGVYAIARCCTWPRAECQINTSSLAAEGAGCSSRDHVLTGNVSPTWRVTEPGAHVLMAEDVSSRRTVGAGGKRVGVSAGWQGRGTLGVCVEAGKVQGSVGKSLSVHVCTGMLSWLSHAYSPSPLGRVQFPLPWRGTG